jgi:serine/threonine-protein kinase HipA
MLPGTRSLGNIQALLAKAGKGSAYYAPTLVQARGIIKEVARATALRRDAAREVGARAAEISRMASAFEHTELQQALAL